MSMTLLGPFGSRFELVLKQAEAEESGDAVAFARERLGVEPDEPQSAMLRGGKRGILNWTRQGGKTTAAAAKAVHRAYTEPQSLTLLLSPSGRQSGEFIRKAKEFVWRLGVEPEGDKHNKMSIQFENGSRIIGLPGNADNLRGFSSVSLLLIDEAAWVSEDAYEAMRPTLAR